MKKATGLLLAVLLVFGVTTGFTVATQAERADAWAVGADSNGGYGYHIWVIASDADILKSGSRTVITSACKARGGYATWAVCGQIFDILIRYVDTRRWSNHGVWVEYYPNCSWRYAGCRPFMRAGRW
jgi:hypothetical protein